MTTGIDHFGDADYRAAKDSSEFSWGPDLTPPGLEDAPPTEGGRYRGLTPPGAPQISVSRDPKG